MMLTTIALAPSCLTQSWVSGTSGIVLGNPYDTSCWAVSRDLSTTISPAICPVGYVSACDASPPPPETQARQYGLVTQHATPGVTKTYTLTNLDRLGNTITRELSGDGGINAHSIRVAFHSFDLVTTPSTAVSAITSRPTLSPSIPSSSPALESVPAAWRSSGLSIGATVGVGVGVGVGVLYLLLNIAWLVWRRRKAGQSVADPDELDTNQTPKTASELPADPPAASPSELDGRPGITHP
ncbi:hypothetical protein F4779DRAFT_618448 [Xylariaceae sp. FL0662B]|nr:hypothetical protein F4779DRAFT_618448 [Xylariaceae sp. FL0662B]